MLCGIDEAGRGPCAGIMVVSGVILLKNIEGLRDSKKLSPKRREILANEIKKKSLYKIVKITPRMIDKYGLSYCIKYALEKITSSLNANEYIFDGNLNYGLAHIKTLIKGDDKIDAISAASILAKETRDKVMIKLSTIDKYKIYDFDKHKGYATKKHIDAIRKYGLSNLHRKSYKLKLGTTEALF